MRRLLLILVAATTLAGQTAGHRPIKCGLGWAGPQGIGGLASIPAFRPQTHTIYITPDSAFAIHYDTTGIHRPPQASSLVAGIPDWVVQLGEAFTAARDTLNLWGYRSANPGPGRFYDVYLTEYGDGVYARTFPDSLVGLSRWTSYIVMDNDFGRDEYYFTHGMDAARVTAAHEYFHAVQMNYFFNGSNIYLYELASTWFEERAHPDVNDWVFWIDLFTDVISQSFSASDGYSVAFFGHYIEKLYTSAVMREMFENMLRTTPELRGLRAMEDALEARGGNLMKDWMGSVVGLLLNGRFPEGYYHPDQAVLPQPALPTADLLSGSTTYELSGLAVDKVVWQPVELEGPATVTFRVQSAPPTFTARVFVDNGAFLIDSLLGQPWVITEVNKFSQIVVAVAGEAGTLTIEATAFDTLGFVPFALSSIAPNPFYPASAGSFTLHYSVGSPIEAAAHRVTIYNLLGQQIYRSLFQRSVDVGYYRISIPAYTVRQWPSGIYLARLDLAGQKALARRFTVLN